MVPKLNLKPPCNLDSSEWKCLGKVSEGLNWVKTLEDLQHAVQTHKKTEVIMEPALEKCSGEYLKTNRNIYFQLKVMGLFVKKN